MSVPDGARRWRPLGERECYLRLYGHRSGQVELVGADTVPTPATTVAPTPLLDEAPALHLVFPVGRPPLRMSGEDIRLDLLRRMAARDEAQEQAA